MDIVARAFAECSPWMFMVLFGATIVVATVLERTLTLFITSHINEEAFMAMLEKLIKAGNLDKAVKLARVASTTVLGAVVLAGLERAADGGEFVRRAMAEASLKAQPKLRRRLNSTWMIGLATLAVGAFGTQQLGGLQPTPGTPTPLPFDQVMGMAPAMAGAAVAAVAVLGAIAFWFRVKKVNNEVKRTTDRLVLMLQLRRPLQ